MAKKNRTILKGIVVSDKMDKSIVVLVERFKMHPLYKKRVRVSKKFMAHDENNEARIGDTVIIEEYRPLSKRKRWILRKIVERHKEGQEYLHIGKNYKSKSHHK